MNRPTSWRQRLSFWLPPYRNPALREEVGDAGTPGIIVLVDLVGLSVQRQMEGLPALYTAFPFAPLVGTVEDPLRSGEEMTRMVRLGHTGLSAVIRSHEPVEPTLRRVLTHPRKLGAEVGGWLDRVLPRLDPRVPVLIRDVIDHAPRSAGLQELLLHAREHERTAREWLKQARLPPLGDWMRIGRALPVILASQASPAASLLSLAVTGGYHDHSSYSNQAIRLVGSRPSLIRKTLGWEWWMWRFLRRRSGRPLHRGEWRADARMA